MSLVCSMEFEQAHIIEFPSPHSWNIGGKQRLFTESNDMLTLIDIKMKDACNCIVTLSKNGKEMVYDCHVVIHGPDNPDGIKALHLPEIAYQDLADYDDIVPGRPHGAPYLPFLRRLYTLVSQVARNIPVELPQVLDER